MELRQLQYFLTVAECGGVSQAAEQLGLTQPNLSRQIKMLEEDCLLYTSPSPRDA